MSWEWVDLLWHLLAYPIYQVLGTIRHEGAHAIVAKLYGAEILEFKFLPFRRDGRFYWGYVGWHGDLDAAQVSVVKKAPYLVNVLLVVVWFVVSRAYAFEQFHWFAFTTAMLLVSPVIDSAYNLFKALVWRRGDLVD